MVRSLSLTLCASVVMSCSSLSGASAPAGTEPQTTTPGQAPTLAAADAISRCDDVPWISAPAEVYRDSPIYIENEQPTEQLRRWASAKPGFVDLWIDRDHNGWVTLAFRDSAADRQRELEAEFPRVGVVAVNVPVTTAELGQLQAEVMDRLGNVPGFVASGQYPNKGVVSIGFDYLEEHKVAIAQERFAGRAVCLDGIDPGLKPSEGDQQQLGDGWRLLADQDETGDSYRTGIAYDVESYKELWTYVRLDGDPPPVDFQSEVVVWFGEVHGSSCPRLRLDDVVVDRERSIVHADVTRFGSGACTADAIPHAYVVALERSRLPNGGFTIQLNASEPPPGVIQQERTIIEVDLSTPGAVAQAGEVHRPQEEPEPYYVGPGDFVETCCATEYRQHIECGVEWLGPLNDVKWRTSDADGAQWIPVEWRDAVNDDGQIVLSVRVQPGDPPTLTATANGLRVVYEATASDQPPCG